MKIQLQMVFQTVNVENPFCGQGFRYSSDEPNHLNLAIQVFLGFPTVLVGLMLNLLACANGNRAGLDSGNESKYRDATFRTGDAIFQGIEVIY